MALPVLSIIYVVHYALVGLPTMSRRLCEVPAGYFAKPHVICCHTSMTVYSRTKQTLLANTQDYIA